MFAFINYPSWLKPEIIQGLPVRWYGLMYAFAFATTYIFFKRQIKEDKVDISEENASSLFFWAVLSLLVGARVFSALFYDQSEKYWLNPLLIFWPFDSNFNFTGLQGMSYHGGLIGIITGIVLYSYFKKLSILKMTDMIAVGSAAGYTFGRIGNFINGELFGRVTDVPWGMIFPYAPSFSTKEAWVQETAEKAGLYISPSDSFVNLPRHPSQLYEAFFEGIFLWAILWFVVRKLVKRKNLPDGTITGCYIMGYGIVRFFIEYCREPDSDLGFIFSFFAEPGKVYPIHRFDSFFNFTMGQILCFLMIIGGFSLICYRIRAQKKQLAKQETPIVKRKKRRKK